MKGTLCFLILATLCLYTRANATIVSARFTFDDGSAVAGNVMLYRVATPADALVGTYALDAQGHVSSDIALDPTATYHAQLVSASGTLLQQVWTASVSNAIASAALQMLPSGEIDVVLAKADDSVKSVQFVQLALPQTKFASCLSTPAFGSAPNPTTATTTDAGGGLVAAYILPGQTFDCPVNIANPGTYPLNVRAETPFTNVQLHFEYPVGTKIGGEVTLTPTISAWGQSDTYQTFAAGTAALPAGQISIRLVVDTPSKWALNLNWFN